MRKRKPDPPALEVKGRERACVVTARRAKWKATHATANERIMRLVRFIWMRRLYWEDRHKLNSVTLGAAMRLGLVWREPDHDKSTDRLLASYREE